MNEQAERYIKLLKKHMDRVVIGTLYLLLFALVGIWYMEQAGGDTTAEEGKPASIPDKIPNNPFWTSVQKMSEPQKIEDYAGIQQIRQYNMFDYKSVKQQEDLLRGLNQKFAQAQEAEKAGRKDEAVKMLKEILQQKPTYRPAQGLLEKLEPKPAAAPAPEGGAETPAAGASPPL